MGLAVSVLSSPFLNHDRTEEVLSKCKLIYWRLLDIVFKVDSIPGQESGGDYLNLRELGTDIRLENKFNLISSALWHS
jgi:hypothetical protein